MTASDIYSCSKDSLKQYLKEIANIPFLSESEEKELGARALKRDLEARNTLVKSHLKLAVSIARKYANRGLELCDLISEGNMGLLFAVEEFNPEKGRLSTYSTYWIKKSISDALKEKSGITYSDSKKDRFADYKTKLKERISTSDKEVEPFKWIDEVLSLDETISKDEDTTFIGTLADESQNPENKIIASNLADNISSILKDYSEIEQACIINFYGLENRKPMKAEEIAEAYKLPLSKVNTVLRKTLRSLRTNEKVLALRGYCQE